MEYNDLISYRHKRKSVKNIYTFELSRDIDDIKESIASCEISSEIFHQRQYNIKYDESCSTIYIDVSDLYMRSLQQPFVLRLIDIMKTHNKIFFLKTLDDMHRDDIINSIFSELENDIPLLEDLNSRLFYI